MKADVQGALKKLNRLAEPLAWLKGATLWKRQMRRILSLARRHGFLVLPYHFKTAGLRGPIRKAWSHDCEKRNVPCVTVHLMTTGDGRIEYHAYGIPFDTFWYLSNTVDEYYKDLSDEEKDRCLLAMKYGGFYSFSNICGRAAFTKEMAPRVVGIVVSFFKKLAV